MSETLHPLRTRRMVQLGTLALGHLLVDMYGGFVAPLIPAFRDRLGVRLSQMAVVVTASQILVNAIQPLAGFVTTRLRWSAFLVLGPALALTLAFLGFAGNFAVLAALILGAHVGIGVFHPDGLMSAHDVSGSRAHVGVPIFLSGGYLGYSLGAWISTQWYYYYHFDGFWLLAAPGVLLLMLIFTTGLAGRGVVAAAKPPARVAAGGGIHFAVLLILGIITVSATCVLFTFLTVHLKARWGDEGMKWGGCALAIFGIAGAVASYLWGRLSHSRSLFGLIAVGQIACIPLYLLLIRANSGPALLALSVPTGMLLGVSFFPLIATAARWSPQLTPGLRAGLIMGGSWGIASLVPMICGLLTEWGVTTGQFLPYMVIPMGLAAALAGWLYVRERRSVS